MIVIIETVDELDAPYVVTAFNDDGELLTTEAFSDTHAQYVHAAAVLMGEGDD